MVVNDTLLHGFAKFGEISVELSNIVLEQRLFHSDKCILAFDDVACVAQRIVGLDKAGKETVRFKELQREIPDISQKMLTERTRSLLPHINALIEWALENKDAIIKDRKKANRYNIRQMLNAYPYSTAD